MKIDLTELLIKVGNEADLETALTNEKKYFEKEGLTLTRPVKIKLHLVNTGTSVLVKGRAETEVELECSRCLEKFTLPLSVDISEGYSKKPSGPKGAAELELHEEDFVYPIEKDNSIDLSETLRQNFLLALPIKALCRPDCKGIGGK